MKLQCARASVLYLVVFLCSGVARVFGARGQNAPMAPPPPPPLTPPGPPLALGQIRILGGGGGGGGGGRPLEFILPLRLAKYGYMDTRGGVPLRCNLSAVCRY